MLCNTKKPQAISFQNCHSFENQSCVQIKAKKAVVVFRCLLLLILPATLQLVYSLRRVGVIWMFNFALVFIQIFKDNDMDKKLISKWLLLNVKTI